MENLESFLEELSELTRKYKLEISGCGCCQSPWVSELEDDQLKVGFKYETDEDGNWLDWFCNK